MKKFLTFLCAVTLVLGLVGSAMAVPVTFFGEDLGLGEYTPLSSWTNSAAAESAFLSNLVGVGTEDFESFADETSAPLSLTFPGAGTATLNGDGEVNFVAHGTTNNVGRYAISGEQYWETGNSFSFTINFSTAISAFGFYGIDAGDFNGQLQLIATNGGANETINTPHSINAPGGSVLYMGFYDLGQTYNGIKFTNTGSSADYFGFDDMTIGTYEQINPNPVPEPSTILLMGIGLLGLVGYSRKRSKKS